MKKKFLHQILIFAGAAALVILLRLAAFRTYIVESDSMAPALRRGDQVLAVNSAFFPTVGKRDRIIIFSNPSAGRAPASLRGSHLILKRIKALPGAQIRVDHGVIYIDDAPYGMAHANPTACNGDWQVPADSYYVLGDNRGRSFDSRDFGVVKKSDIRAVVLMIYFPFSRLGLL